MLSDNDFINLSRKGKLIFNTILFMIILKKTVLADCCYSFLRYLGGISVTGCTARQEMPIAFMSDIFFT